MIQAYSESLTAGSSVVTLESGRILLEWVSACSVTRSSGVDTDGSANTALVTNSLDCKIVSEVKSGGCFSAYR